MDLYYPSPHSESAIVERVNPGNSPLKWITFSQLRLNDATPEWELDTGANEMVIDILGGHCTVHVDAGPLSATFPEIGQRADVFSGRPTMVYVPRDCRVRLFSEREGCDMALIAAPAQNRHIPVLVCPEECLTLTVGKENWQRSVATSIGDNVKADRLLVGETINPPGNWSSSPPHKHDRREGNEVPMEEVYFYRMEPEQGFALQRVYTSPTDTEPFDVTYAVKQDDIVVLPRGYHPVVAAPGYRLFYLWALAGDERKYGSWSDDPAHAWVKEQP